MPPQRYALPSEVPGLTARRIAADILDGVLHKHRTLDEQLEGAGAHPGLKTLADRDRALMRRLVATILRRLGTLGHVLSRLLDRGVPTDAPRAQSALLIGAAQILWMDVPDHAAVDLSVRLVQSDRRAAKYAGLVNAVLRRCAREGKPLIEEVRAGGPGAHAGLKGSSHTVDTLGYRDLRTGGDVIVAIDGKPVRSADDVVRIVSFSLAPGSVAAFTIVRDGQRKTVPVTLSDRDQAPAAG